MARRLTHSVPLVAAAAALLVAAGLAGSAGGARTSAVADAPKGGTLRIGAYNVDSVDPALGYWRDAWLIQDATCARLFRYQNTGDGSFQVLPEVVSRSTVSRDGRTHTFALHETFRFHTGARVTARSFADAFDRALKLRSPAAVYMHEVVGADAVTDGKAPSITGVRVLGPYRLQIRLTKPLGDLPARLTMPFFCPVPPNTPADPPGIRNPAGSGPYYVAEHAANQRILLKRNPFYRGRRQANVDQMVWTTGESVAACLLAVEEDRVDFCGQPGAPRDAWRGLAGKYGVNRPGGQLFVSPTLATIGLAFNHTRPAFRGAGQIPLKKAINFAIDRPAMVRPFGYLGGKRTDQLLPPSLASPSSIYPLGGADVRTARRWYTRARFKPTKLVYYTANTPAWVEVAQTLAFNLEQIGIDLDVKYFDVDAVFQKAATPGEPFDLVNLGWSVDYADAATFVVSLLGRDGIRSGVNLDDARLQRRIDAVNRLTGEARWRGWADLDVDVMRDDPPWAPFMHPQSRIVVSQSVGCVVLHPIVTFDITALCKKR